MSAPGKVVRAGVGRRRTQTLVILLTTMMAVTASVLAAGLLMASRGPFDHAFAEQHGAQLTARFDAAKADAAQVAATARLSAVTAAAGPYPVLTLSPDAGANSSGWVKGQPLAPMTVVGRSGAGGPVDDLRLTSGHWATGAGQIVLAAGNAPLGLGDRLTFPSLPGRPELTVVGLASSAGGSADGWVPPGELAALTAPGTAPDYQMLYRFRSAATDAQVSADRAGVTAAAPAGSMTAGSMTAAASYLQARRAADQSSAEYVPFVVAFGVLGLVMSILVIGIVVSGAVGAATWRIGILKSLGFTPAQVVRAYVGQALIPAAAGTALGVLLGNLAAVPVLSTEGTALGSGATTIAPWIDLVVPAAVLTAVVLTALAPALRAGRLRTAEAVIVGRTPRAGRGRAVQRLLGGLPLPRSLSLGLAQAFSRPARSATTAAAVILGTLGATFGVGLAVSLGDVQNGLDRRSPGQVVLLPYHLPAPGATTMPAQAGAATVAAAINALPGTGRWFSMSDTQVGVAGLAGQTTVISYQGDSSWGAYQMVAGSWFDGPGQAVVPSGFLQTTGTRIGDTVTLTNDGRSAPVRIVGEAFDLQDEGMVIMTDASSLAGLRTTAAPMTAEYDIDLTPGTSSQAYASSLQSSLRAYHVWAMPHSSRPSATVLSMDALTAMLTLMLLAVAGLGVLNTVLLDTRERVHDLGVLKALGMAPAQAVAMIVTSVAGIGLLAGGIGVPLGVVLHDLVLPAMGDAAGTDLPAADLAVYHLPLLAPLLLGGLAIATLGALLPAGWAARTRTAAALRTE
jgi:putative ABC transport system permease protein